MTVRSTVDECRDHHRRIDDEDQAFLAGARQFQQLLEHPFAVGFLAVAGVLILFWLGIGVGETLYGTFDGNVGGAALFAIILVTAIAVVVGLASEGRQRHHISHLLADQQH